MEMEGEDHSTDDAEESVSADIRSPRPKRTVKFGLGIDIKASVDEFMRRNKDVMGRLKNL